MKKLMLSLFATLLAFSAHAENNMAFHGTLVAPPCTISNGQTIEVDFGNNLGVNKIDGVNYLKRVEYQVTCEGGYSASGLAIVIDTTNPAAFDSSAVRTDKTGLGVRILIGSRPATFGTRIPVNDPASPPRIEAVPVQDPVVTLTAGAFDATLTLRTDYM
ncbi:fimbrial protein [Cronobacter dublinensis]|uniref:fimbrial protein n=1 Tax=Cronobacter dublinensis TaxID=413497 RepID=UPI0023DD1237|nr:fimbrial protein [Cronobacter dublinensis]MDT3666902.1 fimbrial protein [Cronobacter dublinensis]WEP44782.1 fimbrial protein [Cronobacter dublinensis]